MGTLLSHIKTTVPSVKGDIHIELKREEQSLSLDLDSPADTTAIISLPKLSHSKVSKVLAGDKVIWQQGRAQDLPAGLTFLAETGQAIQWSAKPGHHTLSVEYEEE
jgi:hypothetical protein